ncbi:hypothetical protein DCCM_3237 [Desulfocucumis palustris]|uniref:Uncharacterized protein n=1 Tax=Desulfocucumis palustris TaxID=1898651 RepID=A0A2L2XD24_9FIRM|nr:hypothetical protein DCCM_3237 [Desulfocucumis palustris]
MIGKKTQFDFKKTVIARYALVVIALKGIMTDAILMNWEYRKMQHLSL